jgi:hypothetical protein
MRPNRRFRTVAQARKNVTENVGVIMVRQRFAGLAFVLAWFAAGMPPCSGAVAQDAAPPTIAEQLQAQYKPVRLGSDSNGIAVIDPGTVLTIRKDGILGVPWGDPKPCASTYENGSLRPPRGLCVQGRGFATSFLKTLANNLNAASGDTSGGTDTTAQTRNFKAGEKVYLQKFAIDVKGEKVVFSVVACDTCNNTDPPTFFKATVAFQFAKGFLEQGDVSQVEDTIGQVLSLDDSGGTQ